MVSPLARLKNHLEHPVNMLNSTMRFSLLLSFAFLSACTGLPKGVTPVDDFEITRYLGTWYEVARLDHRFERGLEKVTATYELNEDGSVRVTNKGFKSAKGKWSEAVGKAKFVGEPTTAHLKVSFFGPFYASYVIFDLAEDYSTAAVSGNNKSNLWLLARTPTVDGSVIEEFKGRAQALGFATEELILVDH